ncbi:MULTISPECIES: TetR/AcrR family transcriptional regulator [Pseudofrankia]|uniref:TetR/AcrR family transcriptional regulator n=1 Tax=Pseudofrankia TaxID=2994363 RepID=UPI000234DB4C|nr:MULTISPECIES: TetR/AcrR family transcriptional regulator [Pseudofrankia]
MLRSRSALFAAAVRLVSERGTADVPVTDLAEAADVTRKVIYTQFGDRESLLVEAAVDLVNRELFPRLEDGAEAEGLGALAVARHFARYRSFYRPMLSGSCAFAMTRALNSAFSSFQGPAMRRLFGELDQDAVDDLAAFFMGGTAAIVNDWLFYGADPLDPEELADRMLRLVSVLTGGQHPRADRGRVR